MEYYDLLEITNVDCSTEEITKAYRQKALRLHPDKNRTGHPTLVKEQFHALSEAYAVLCDPTARSLYNAKIKLERERKERDQKMDQKRKDLKEALLEREKQAILKRKQTATRDVAASPMAATFMDMETIKRKFQEELEKIRKKQKVAMGATLAELNLRTPGSVVFQEEEDLHGRTLKLKWHQSNTQVNHNFILKQFSKFGVIENLHIIQGGGMAILICESIFMASNILRADNEYGTSWKSHLNISLVENNDRQKYTGHPFKGGMDTRSTALYHRTVLTSDYTLEDYEKDTFEKLRRLRP